jgi:hypothetical protein
MTKEEALKLALDALEGALSDDKPYIAECKVALDAIKEALAQPAQEPVAWEQFYPDMGKPQRPWVGRDCPHCKDYRAMYIKVRDELAAEQQVTQRQTARIVDLQTHIANLEGEE